MPKIVEEATITVSSRCTPALRRKLKAKAKKEDTTLSTVVYEACIAALTETD
jgi:hypothetical protein